MAATDTYSLYNTSMETDRNSAGISRSGTSGEYTHSVINNGGDSGDRPITYVSWFDAARFANWMHNGEGTGSTKTGAYTISTGQITAASRTGGVNTYTLAAPSTLSVGDQVAVTGLVGTAFNVRRVVTSVSGLQFTMANSNSDAVATGTGSMTGASPTAASNARFSIPTEDEWYKAAYYSPLLNSGSGGYWTYATQSNTDPGNVVAFTNSASYYGTYDQSGNADEWNAVITETTSGSPNAARGLRGGNWGTQAQFVSSSDRPTARPSLEDNAVGFRLAAPGAPQPR